MPNITAENLDHVFTYHAPKGDQAQRYGKLREAARAFAGAIMRECPESPERTLALRDVQRATMMANASIALNE